MRARFKIPLFIIGALLCFCIFLGVFYFFYTKSISDDAVVLVDSNLSINYVTGNEFNQRSHKTINFSVTNTSDELTYYYLTFSDVSGTVPYTIESKDNNINVSNDLTNGIISSYISIKGKTTQNYTLIFTATDDAYHGKIEVKKEATNYKTFGDIILDKNEEKDEPVTTIGVLAHSNEGLIKGTDDAGTTYYFRGSVDNNYVSFAGLTWRIVRINGDGSVKLVLNNLINTDSAYYNDNGPKFEDSLIKNTLDSYYKNTLINYGDDIATQDFCNDILSDQSGYTGYKRIMVNKIFTYNCLSNKVKTTIGLMTIDEMIYAGLSTTEANTTYYLHNNEITKSYYLMSTSGSDANGYYPFTITNDAINTTNIGTSVLGLRPVINIVKNVSADGSGTLNDPYIIKALES